MGYGQISVEHVVRIRSSFICSTKREEGRYGAPICNWAALVSICNIAIHALVMTADRGIASDSPYGRVAANLLLIAVMVATVSVLMAAHTCEVLFGRWPMVLVDAAPAGSDLLDFAFVNYTTLGYGNVLPVERWRLLGPMTAMNGVLLFGWSTAVIFEVLRKARAAVLEGTRRSTKFWQRGRI